MPVLSNAARVRFRAQARTYFLGDEVDDPTVRLSSTSSGTAKSAPADHAVDVPDVGSSPGRLGDPSPSFELKVAVVDGTPIRSSGLNKQHDSKDAGVSKEKSYPINIIDSPKEVEDDLDIGPSASGKLAEFGGASPPKPWHQPRERTSVTVARQLVSGATVALAMIPEAVAFSFVARVSPPVALTAAWIMCFLTAALGGRPGMISGATGSMAVIMTSLVEDRGLGYLLYAVLLCGVFQLLLACVNIHKALQFVTLPVKLGFLNGLALIIAKSQLESFLIPGRKVGHLKILEFSVPEEG